jgi:tetratricopeptide (TPR) repeat protein
VPRLSPIALLALLATVSLAQDSSNGTASDKSTADKTASGQAGSGQSPSSQSAPSSTGGDQDAAPSSSHDSRIDISVPRDDAKNHPGSKAAVSDLDGTEKPDDSGVQEFHPWNPMRAIKDLEVGDYYFRRKNYKAALDRYMEALYYKDGDALASFRAGETLEKLGRKTEAKKYYEQYLKILPEGPLAKEVHASLEKMAKAQ